MPSKRITDFTTPTGGVSINDIVPIVDVSDTTDNAAGSSRKIRLGDSLGIPVDNVAAMVALTGMQTGDIVDVTSYYANKIGGGRFIYDATKSATNDYGSVINGWVRQFGNKINLSEFGVGGLDTDASRINAAFNAAATLGKHITSDKLLIKVTETLYFRRDVNVDFGGSTLMNYSGADACVPHSSDGIVYGTVENVTLTYQNYGTSLNSNYPPYTIDKTKQLGQQITWTHSATFTGDGFKYSGVGRYFQNLKNCTVKWHRYGFMMLGWVVRLTNCTANYNLSGFYGYEGLLSGTRYPVHNLVLEGCNSVSNQNYGFDIRWADDINFVACHAEKNYVNNVRLEGCRGVTGSVYQEYSTKSILAYQCKGVTLGGYAGGNATTYKTYAKAAQAYYEETLAGGVTTINVTAYNAGTSIGIDNFASIADADIAVIKNNRYLSSGYTRVGSAITITGGVNGDVISVVAYAFRNPATELQVTQDKYELGAIYPVEIQHSQNVTINGSVDQFITGTVLFNDWSGGLSASADVYFNANLDSTTPKSTNAALFYPWGSGFLAKQSFYAGIGIRNSSDANVNSTISATQSYPGNGSSGTISISNAVKSIIMLVGGDGCALLTIDGNGDLYPACVSGAKLAIANTNPAVSGKLNFYKSGVNAIAFQNLLGYATQITVVKLQAA